MAFSSDVALLLKSIIINIDGNEEKKLLILLKKGQFFCNVCNVELRHANILQHFEGAKHIRKERKLTISKCNDVTEVQTIDTKRKTNDAFSMTSSNDNSMPALNFVQNMKQDAIIDSYDTRSFPCNLTKSTQTEPTKELNEPNLMLDENKSMDLAIAHCSINRSLVGGGQKILILLNTKVPKEIEVHFCFPNSNRVTQVIKPKDITFHHQIAMIFTTQCLENQNAKELVKAQLYLYDPKSGSKSQPMPFFFYTTNLNDKIKENLKDSLNNNVQCSERRKTDEKTVTKAPESSQKGRTHKSKENIEIFQNKALEDAKTQHEGDNNESEPNLLDYDYDALLSSLSDDNAESGNVEKDESNTGSKQKNLKTIDFDDLRQLFPDFISPNPVKAGTHHVDPITTQNQQLGCFMESRNTNEKTVKKRQRTNEQNSSSTMDLRTRHPKQLRLQ